MGQYSVYEPTRNEAVAVGVTAVSIAEPRVADNKRKVIMLRNISTDPADIIYVWFSSSGTATVGSGIQLRQGESVTDSNDSGYECYQDKITAICVTANGNLSVMER